MKNIQRESTIKTLTSKKKQKKIRHLFSLELKKDFWLKANKVGGRRLKDKRIKGCLKDKSQKI